MIPVTPSYLDHCRGLHCSSFSLKIYLQHLILMNYIILKYDEVSQMPVRLVSHIYIYIYVGYNKS